MCQEMFLGYSHGVRPLSAYPSSLWVNKKSALILPIHMVGHVIPQVVHVYPFRLFLEDDATNITRQINRRAAPLLETRGMDQ